MAEKSLHHSGAPMADLVTDRIEDDEIGALREIVAGTASETGTQFFQHLVQHLAKAMDVGYAFIAEFIKPNRARSVAFWTPSGITQNVEWELAGTPCEEVVAGHWCHYASGVQRKFPKDDPLVAWGIESYLGVPLISSDGQTLGHLAILDPRKMPEEPKKVFIFKIFAARAAAELNRLRVETMLRESENRFKDLFDEAPIAYVLEDVNSRFIRANRTAMRTLGIKPEEVEGTIGRSLIPDTPEARAQVDQALDSIGKGNAASGIVFELRRKDDGRPIWVQWWSKPEPGGTLTRTMFIDITDRVLMQQEKDRLAAQNTYLQEEIKSVHNFEEIVGRSPALLQMLENVNRVAKTDASVLITGETGTGKELIARAIHSAGKRRDKPLIKVNCAALPQGLVESELFGHEKGAFSGAVNRRIGRFELAQGGTIFLDEIGEVPMDVQVKLLRVLQEREFERVGGSGPIKVDVRIIAATNRDLSKAIRDGHFREDLFYRLNVFPVSLPPLRDRDGDVKLLSKFLVNKFSARIGKRIEAISDSSMCQLNAYRWPGNIRELENILERAIILSNSSTLEIDPDVFGPTPAAAADSPQPVTTPAPALLAGNQDLSLTPLELVERDFILAALKQTQWVIEGPHGSAKILDMHPNTLRSRLKKLGIERPSQ
jgi:formate hydrogenlyase transcriptional activator